MSVVCISHYGTDGREKKKKKKGKKEKKNGEGLRTHPTLLAQLMKEELATEMMEMMTP